MIKALNEQECSSILKNNFLGYLAYIFNNEPSVVPITYFFDGDNTIICYTNEGHKSRALRINKKVSLVTTEIKNLSNWKSVKAQGVCEEVFGSTSKAYLRDFSNGIKKIAHQKEGIQLDFLNEFTSKTEEQSMPAVFKIDITYLVGKSQVAQTN